MQPLYYKLLIMCQKNIDMKTVIYKKETEVRKERWPCRQTGIFYLSSEIICSEAACSLAAFHGTPSRCFILTTVLAFLFSSLSVLTFCFVISSMSFITKNILSTGTLVPVKETPMQIRRMLRECEN